MACFSLTTQSLIFFLIEWCVVVTRWLCAVPSSFFSLKIKIKISLIFWTYVVWNFRIPQPCLWGAGWDVNPAECLAALEGQVPLLQPCFSADDTVLGKGRPVIITQFEGGTELSSDWVISLVKYTHFCRNCPAELSHVNKTEPNFQNWTEV